MKKYLKRPWIIILTAFLLVAAVLVLGYQSFKATQKASFDEFNQRQLVLAREAAHGIGLYFEILASNMRDLARHPTVQQFDETSTRQEIQDMLYELEPWGVNDIAVLDANGVVIYNAVAHQLEGVDFSWRKYYQEAREMTSSGNYVIEFIEFKGVEAGQKGVLLAVPMFETVAGENHSVPSGQFAGVVLATLKLDTVTQRFVAPVRASKRGHAFFIDDEYSVLWSPDRLLFGENLWEAGKGFPGFQRVLETMAAGGTGMAQYSYYQFKDTTGQHTGHTTEQNLIAYAPIRLGTDLLAIGVWAPEGDAQQLIWSVYLNQLFVVGLSILIVLLGSAYALALSYRTSKHLKQEVEDTVEELQETESRYRRLVKLSPDAIAVQCDDKFIFMNKAGTILFGAKNSADLIGKSIWNFVLPEDRELLKEQYRQMRDQGVQMPVMEQRFIRVDGLHFEAEVVAAPFIYKGKPAIQTIFHNLVRRRQVQKALEEARVVQQAIIESIAQPAMVIDADYQVKLMNRAARKFSAGVSNVPEPAFCYQISHQDEAPCKGSEHPCPMIRVRELRQPISVIHKHYYADGDERFVEITASPLFGPDGTFQGIIETARHISDRELAKVALAQQTDDLAHSDDDLEEFTHKVTASIQDFLTKLE